MDFPLLWKSVVSDGVLVMAAGDGECLYMLTGVLCRG